MRPRADDPRSIRDFIWRLRNAPQDRDANPVDAAQLIEDLLTRTDALGAQIRDLEQKATSSTTARRNGFAQGFRAAVEQARDRHGVILDGMEPEWKEAVRA